MSYISPIRFRTTLWYLFCYSLFKKNASYGSYGMNIGYGDLSYTYFLNGINGNFFKKKLHNPIKVEASTFERYPAACYHLPESIRECPIRSAASVVLGLPSLLHRALYNSGNITIAIPLVLRPPPIYTSRSRPISKRRGPSPSPSRSHSTRELKPLKILCLEPIFKNLLLSV